MNEQITTIGQITQQLDQWFPRHLAASWDNTGLLIGNKINPAKRVLCCLTVTLTVVDEAIEMGADLVISHHPVMFKAIQNLTYDSIEGKSLLGLCQNNIAVYSPHTSHDGAHGGINEQLANHLDLTNIRPLISTVGTRLAKLVVFVPSTHVDSLSHALFSKGAGNIGKYSACSFRSTGTGTFLGGLGTNPTIGTAGRAEIVDEIRLEVVISLSDQKIMESTIRAFHPYEEPAFDIYPLSAVSGQEGDGRIGALPAPESLGTVANRIASRLPYEAIQVMGSLDSPIRTIAIGCGAAGDWVKEAHKQGADLFLTGEMRYHDQLWAHQAGISIVVAGHHATEAGAIPVLAHRIRQAFSAVDVAVSKRDHATSHWIIYPEKSTTRL